jgi:hypothetical protein
MIAILMMSGAPTRPDTGIGRPEKRATVIPDKRSAWIRRVPDNGFAVSGMTGLEVSG